MKLFEGKGRIVHYKFETFFYDMKDIPPKQKVIVPSYTNPMSTCAALVNVETSIYIKKIHKIEYVTLHF